MSGWQSVFQTHPSYSATNGEENQFGFGGQGSKVYQTYHSYESGHQGFNNNVGFAHQDFVGQQQVYQQGYQGHSNGAVGSFGHRGHHLNSWLRLIYLSPAIGVMGGAQVFMVGGQQEEVINSQVRIGYFIQMPLVIKVEIILQVVNLMVESSVEELAGVSPQRSPYQMVNSFF